MNKFYVFNAGCIRRCLDCVWIKKYLEVNGWQMVGSPKKADLIIVSTCGVVSKNEENSLLAVAQAVQGKKDNAKTVITGCLTKINPDSLNALGEFYHVPSGSLEEMDKIVKPRIPITEVHHPDSVKDGGALTDYLIARSFCRSSDTYKSLFDKYAMNNTFLRASVVYGKILGNVKSLFSSRNIKKILPYYNIKIADGCKSICTYCATRFATKKLRSRSVGSILEDFDLGLENGYEIFQLLSEDSGCYGLDINSSITELLTSIFERDKDFKVILIDFNPWWLIKQQEQLIPLLKMNQDKVKEIFLPFQSGSDKILGLMEREYRSDELISVLKLLRKEAPMIPIRTSALVGFPSEDDADFEDTKRVIQEVDFAEVAVNRYEDRPGTASSSMPGKLSQDIIEFRARYLVENLNCKMLS